MRNTFATTDDCKPLADGKRILVSSSSGGCALVDYPTGQVQWYARVPNAHSIELLPQDRIVVAASVGAKGNRLMVFDISQQGKSLCEVPLPSAHGVVWDAAHKRLWALGFHNLYSYELKDWETQSPTLHLDATHPLPDDDGHDLQSFPGGNDLIFSTAHHVYLFNRDTHTFRLHPDLGDKPDVKSITFLPNIDRTAFVQAEGKDWWSGTIQFLKPSDHISLKPDRIYKARWFPFPVSDQVNQ